MQTSAPLKEASIEITVIRADGSIEELGIVSYWHRNPMKRLAHRLRSIRGNLRR